MSPIENPTISSMIPRRPRPSYPPPPPHRRDSETLRFGNGYLFVPTSDTSPHFPVPYIDQYSQGRASSDALPPTNDHLFPTPTPQTSLQRGIDQQPPVVRHLSFNNSGILTSSPAFRCIYSYIRTILATAFNVSPLRHLLKLPVSLYFFILEVQSCIPRLYSNYFAYARICPHSAAERGDIGNVERLWAEKAQVINAGYVTIATCSSGAIAVIVTFLQLVATTPNTVVTTLTFSAITFVILAILCSVMYIAYNANMSSPGVAVAWSQAIDDTAPFWQVLALPFQFVLLASAFTCAAVLVFAWIEIGKAGPAGGDSTPTAPATTLPASGASSAPPPSALVPGPDLVDRLSIPLCRALVTLFIVYGIWKIVDARKKLTVMARNDPRRAAVRRTIETLRETDGPAVGNSS